MSKNLLIEWIVPGRHDCKHTVEIDENATTEEILSIADKIVGPEARQVSLTLFEPTGDVKMYDGKGGWLYTTAVTEEAINQMLER